MGSGRSYSLGYKGFRDGVVMKDRLLRGQKAQSLADTRNSMCDVMKTQNMGRKSRQAARLIWKAYSTDENTRNSCKRDNKVKREILKGLEGQTQVCENLAEAPWRST